jgi:hypothetical protein
MLVDLSASEAFGSAGQSKRGGGDGGGAGARRRAPTTRLDWRLQDRIETVVLAKKGCATRCASSASCLPICCAARTSTSSRLRHNLLHRRSIIFMLSDFQTAA